MVAIINLCFACFYARQKTPKNMLKWRVKSGGRKEEIFCKMAYFLPKRIPEDGGLTALHEE